MTKARIILGFAAMLVCDLHASPVFAMEDVATGRWLTRDPVDYRDGANAYVFVRNNPALGFDPSGHVCVNEPWSCPGGPGDGDLTPPPSTQPILCPPGTHPEPFMIWGIMTCCLCVSDANGWIPPIQPPQPPPPPCIEWYGNWCGPGWSGGLCPGQVGPPAPAVDAQDSCCEDHDNCYASNNCTCPCKVCDDVMCTCLRNAGRGNVPPVQWGIMIAAFCRIGG